MAIPGLRHLLFDLRGDGVGILTIDRPPVNALGRDLVEDLDAACAAIEPRMDLRVLVLAAKGKAFCAGADLKERQAMTDEEVREWVPRLSGTFTRIARLPIPTIACIQGMAAGGGLELALACDLRVAEVDATLGLREVSLGIIPGAGGTQRLPRIIGESRARKWIFTARIFGATEAFADGVVDRIAPAGRGVDVALDLAAEIAANAPLALRAAKRAMLEGIGLPLDQGLEAERRAYETIIPTEDRREALRAFAERRKPDFKGR